MTQAQRNQWLDHLRSIARKRSRMLSDRMLNYHYEREMQRQPMPTPQTHPNLYHNGVRAMRRDPLISNPRRDAAWSMTVMPNRRCLTVLDIAGISTLEELSQKTEQEMQKYTNIGKKTISQLRAVLKEHGLDFTTYEQHKLRAAIQGVL